MPTGFKNKYAITPNYIPGPSKRRAGLPISKVRFLVAHDTGNPGSTASQNVRYYINSRNEISASAHLFVDDKEIIECVPALTAPPEKAWHVLYGVPKDNELYGVNANDAAIGVEYCYGGTIDADKAYQKYVWVLAKLCFEFELDPEKDIVGHFFLDPKRKTDPVTGLANSRRTYEQLLRDVVAEFNECTGVAVVPPPVNTAAQAGTVIVTVKLNVRKQPNTRADIVQVLSPGTALNFVARVDNGQAINNNPVWYKDANDNYFWSGGVKQNQ
ncbi:MAG TPA: N-acetylmuramoyl-L-alanine amidase [Ferruginibacter sp.]|nr:N-acetylmuramoyl-L-alanine amidase [Ferruginibacter sp.]